MLIWFGKSERPVPTTAAPAETALSGIISGTGLAIAKTIAPSAIDDTMFSVTISGAETPIKTSAPFITSARVPFSPLGFVFSERALCASERLSMPSHIAPNLSHIIKFFSPSFIKCSPIAVPAAPAPLITHFISPILLPTSFNALSIAAATTIAVPCWSSWKTGISQISFNFRSISKQRGAEISSRLIPPKLPDKR